jgi:hypothetical protein
LNLPLDPEELLRAFSVADVRYVLVGGLAVNAHGVIRATKDMGICPDPERENLVRLAALVRDLGARQVGMEDVDAAEMPVDPTKAEDLALGGNFRLETRLGVLDVMQWLSGIGVSWRIRRSPRTPCTSSWRAWTCRCARSRSCAP